MSVTSTFNNFTAGPSIADTDEVVGKSGTAKGAERRWTFTTVKTWAQVYFTHRANNLSDVASASAARTNLGLAIGTNVQAWSSTLDAIAAGTWTGAGSITTLGTITSGVWHGSAIANAYLANSAITIAGTSTSLGGSITLDTLTGLAATGLVARTAANTLAARTLTGTANEITVTNGNGVSGDPTLSLPSALTFTGKTITGGTYASAALNGTLGATTPAAATVTTLTASSTVTLSALNTANGLLQTNGSGVVSTTLTPSGLTSLGVNSITLNDILITRVASNEAKIATQYLDLSAAAGTARGFAVLSGSNARWVAGADASAESGSNVGSDYVLSRYTDGGTFIDSPFKIARGDAKLTATGVVSFTNTTSGTSTTAAAILGKSMGLTENLFVGGTLTIGGTGSWINILNAASGGGQILSDAAAGDLHFGANAQYTGSQWNRVNTGAVAWRAVASPSGDNFIIARAPSGANPISWTTLLTLNSTTLTAAGNLTVSGLTSTFGDGSVSSSVTLNSARSVTLQNGQTIIKGNSGGWILGYNFKGSAGTALGGLWAYGNTDSLNNFFIGDGAATAWVTFTSTATTIAASTASTSTSTGAFIVNNVFAVGGASGNVYAAGAVNVAGDLNATSTSNHAILVNGAAAGTGYGPGQVGISVAQVATAQANNDGWFAYGQFGGFNVNSKTGTSAGTLYISNLGGSGTLPNQYGIYVEALTRGTVNYVLKSAGAGLVSIGDTTEATTGGAGSLTTAGGIYATKKIIAGGQLIALGAAQNVTGSRGGNAALASLLTQLAAIGLITDSTS